MKKKIMAAICIFIVCIYSVIPAMASTAPNTVANGSPQIQTSGAAVADGHQMMRLYDGASLLTEEEALPLLNKLNEISDRQQCDVVIFTVNSLEGYSSSAYADNIYDGLGFGMGPGRDGILFLISMENRDWAISTCGYGITAFTDEGQKYITDQIIPYLSEGDYATGFNEFADLCDQFITEAKAGEPYDVGNMPHQSLSLLWIPAAILIGFIIALICVLVMKGQLKTVRRQPEAASYLNKESFRLTDNRDNFLYHTVTRVAIPKNTDSGGGGSSTHVSSSGTTHGGSSGKF